MQSIGWSTIRSVRCRAAARRLVAPGYLLVLLVLPAASLATEKAFWHPELAPAGPMVMLVSLDEQRIYVYRNGVAIGATQVSTGRPGHETPTGVYTILQKERVHHSNLYDNAPMPFMQRLTWDGLALHAGSLPGHPASHGCIRLPAAFAERLFAVSPRGTVVVVTDQQVAPPELNHPAAIAPLGLEGAGEESAGAGDMPWPPDDGGPLSVVASTHDRALYVLQSGRVIARTPMSVSEGFEVGGMLLYVRRADGLSATREGGGGLWSAYRVLGEGTAPAPRDLATRLKVPDAFGARLRERIAVGTTVLVTDLPARGGQPVPYGTLLEAREPVPQP
ncbi:MAG TPA: L,D-transpeptidase family protein [Frateuria sp.]|uniref:L,D-transpeptidase family protein n=1 Tax=Frateuria sp. TaxID=2211372 RepID=UPI002D7E82DF|nr:L,D-transpeptidase family protein [Frateuria sp.]HET6805541.1 L,D-transpeptidase family protein [Frateuria sp.]